MSEREFRQWIRYASARPLPARRVEIYLAQLASVVAQCAGNSELTLSDFLLEFKPRKAEKKMTAQAMGSALAGLAGRGVHKLGQGRKR